MSLEVEFFHYICGLAGMNDSFVVCATAAPDERIGFFLVDDPEMPPVVDACMPGPSWWIEVQRRVPWMSQAGVSLSGHVDRFQ